MSCWPVVVTNSMAAAAMFSKLSDTLSKYVCGISPPTTAADDGRYQAGLRSLFLLSPSPERHQPLRSPSPSASVRTEALEEEEDDDDGNNVTAAMMMPPFETRMKHELEEEMASTLPLLAFASERGYMLFSLAEMRMLGSSGCGVADDAPPMMMPPVPGRRLVPSPYGGTVLATDVCYRHPCHLVDPFTGARAPLPDLPIPFSEKEPVDYHPDDDPSPRRRARVTGDGLAWDWSPRGLMVARGDTAFFLAHGAGGGGEEWTPVHQAARGSPMTVNYRGGSFFLLELRSLVTTVIDAGTLRARAVIPPPPGRAGIDAAHLAPCSASDAVLLVHRAGDHGGARFTDAYRLRERGGRPRWSRARDIGDRAMFVDGAHAFTVAAGAARARANRVYAVHTGRVERPCGRPAAVSYDVCFFELTRPECMVRVELDVGEVEPMWGQPHWIMRRREDS